MNLEHIEVLFLNNFKEGNSCLWIFSKCLNYFRKEKQLPEEQPLNSVDVEKPKLNGTSGGEEANGLLETEDGTNQKLVSLLL